MRTHSAGHDLKRCAWVVTCAALVLACGCTTAGPSSGNGESLSQLQTTGNRIGPARVTPEQIQSEVEAFADRFVNAFTQACDAETREHPEARNALHSIKLATASGAYTIAAGPNPVVAAIDSMVQVTLLRHSISTFVVPRLLEGDGGQLLDVLERYEQQAWSMGERVLTDAQRTELRGLIDTWIAENPSQIYVAGVRFSDFARLRPSASRSGDSVFSWLRIDPFSSIKQTGGDIEEARLLAERIFYYAQRMPQLMTWRAEQLHYTIMGSREIEGLLADVNAFNQTSKNLTKTAEELRTLIPDQTGEAVTKLNEALSKQRQETFEQLETQQQELSTLLEKANTTIGEARNVTADVKGTLKEAERVGESLRTASQAVGDAGDAWTGTIVEFQKATELLKPKDDGAAAEPAEPGEDVAFSDVVRGLEQMEQTATELRALLEDINTTAGSEDLSRNVTTSVDRTRRSMEGLVNHVTVRVIIVIAAALVAAVVYRVISSRMKPKRSASG